MKNDPKIHKYVLSNSIAFDMLAGYAPQAIEHKFEINTENNTLASHFNAALGYLNNAIESERN